MVRTQPAHTQKNLDMQHERTLKNHKEYTENSHHSHSELNLKEKERE